MAVVKRCLNRAHVRLAALCFIPDKGHHKNDHQRLRPSSDCAVFSLNTMRAKDSFQYFHSSVKNITEKRSALLFCLVLSCMGLKLRR